MRSPGTPALDGAREADCRAWRASLRRIFLGTMSRARPGWARVGFVLELDLTALSSLDETRSSAPRSRRCCESLTWDADITDSTLIPYPTGEAGRVRRAILDVDLNGQPIWPVAEVLVARGLPFVFATGYGQRGVPEPYRGTPTLGKPFDADALEQAIKAVL